MKTKVLIYMVVLVVVTSSCTVQSLHPLYEEETAIKMPALEGDWVDGDGLVWNLSTPNRDENNGIHKNMSKKMYRLAVAPEGEAVDVDVFLVQLGGSYFMDLFPAHNFEEKIENKVLTGTVLPVHVFSKFRLSGDTLFLNQFETDWLDKLIKNNQIRISHERIKMHDLERIVLTASTRDLQKFVTKYHDTEEAFSKTDTLYRKR